MLFCSFFNEHFIQNPSLQCIYRYIGCNRSSLLHVGFLQLQQVGATLHCGAQASHCSGFSCRAQTLGAWASAVAAHGLSSCSSWALECMGFCSCGTQAQLLQGMSLPRPQIEPVSHALASGFLSTIPPGNSPFNIF